MKNKIKDVGQGIIANAKLIEPSTHTHSFPRSAVVPMRLGEESGTGTEDTEEHGGLNEQTAGGSGRGAGPRAGGLGRRVLTTAGRRGGESGGGDDVGAGSGAGEARRVGQREGRRRDRRPGGGGGGGGGGAAGAVGHGRVARSDGDRLGHGLGRRGGDVLFGGHHGKAGGQDGDDALELHCD